MRHKVILFSGFFGLLIVLSTEILSFYSAINRFNIIFLWLIIASITIYFVINNLNYKNFLIFEKIKKEKFLLFFISLVLLITFVICFFYLPNNADAMSYRFPRILMWIQNNNVNFFQTPDQRQLFMAPFADYLILHLYLVFDNALYINIVQWLAMFLSLISASLITKELGGSLKAQITSMFFVSSIPLGILQSTSMQTDYVISLWFLNYIYFMILYKNNRNFKNIIGLSIALGLGILSKQNMYFFSFPFLIILFSNFKNIEKKLFLKHLTLIGIIVISINYSHLSRTFNLYKNFTSSHQDNIKLLNESISPKYVASNIIRNLSFNLTLPNKTYNEHLRNLVKKFHKKINVSITETKNTFGKDFYIYFNTYENHAPNSLHFFLFLFSLIFIHIKKIKLTHVKEYMYLLIVGFIIFSIVLKWQPTGNRYLLPIFVALCPILALVVEKFKNNKIKNLIIAIFCIWALPFLFMNQIRPLLPALYKNIVKSNTGEILKKTNNNRNYLFFINSRHNEYKIYMNIAEIIKNNKCSNLGITRGYAEFEYPLIMLIKKEMNNIDLKITYSNVRNLTKDIDQDNSAQVCTYIEFKCDINDVNCSYVDKINLSQRFKIKKMSKNINLYVLNS